MPYENALKRATIGATIVMALRDMRNNPGRSIRNAMDSFENYAGEGAENIRIFQLRKILEENWHGLLRFLLFMVKHVDLQTIKAVGTNLLFNRMPSADAGRAAQPEYCEVPTGWDSGAQAAVRSGKEKNAYFFVLYGHRLLTHRDIIFDLCRQNRDCVFYLLPEAQEIDDDFARRAAEAKNVIISVKIRTDLPEAEFCRGNGNAFSLLKKYRCMFGFSALVDSARGEISFGRHFLDYAGRAGCLFGCYSCGKSADGKIYERKIREIIKKTRIFQRIPTLADETLDRTLQNCFEFGGRGYLLFGRKRLHARYSLSVKH